MRRTAILIAIAVIAAACSSAESELYGAVKATSEAMGLTSMFADLGVPTKACVMTDASATLSIIRRNGLGKLRHINTNYLWVQERQAQKDVDYEKVVGSQNTGDLMTKALNKELIDRFCNNIGIEFLEGSDDIAFSIYGLEDGAIKQALGRILKD